MIRRDGVGQVVHYILKLSREIPQAPIYPVCQRQTGFCGAAGRSAQTEVDPAGIKRLQLPERFSHFKWAVLRQQDAAGTDADVRGFCRNMGD